MSANLQIFFLFLLPLLSLVHAQGRAPHGLVYNNPTASSPAAYDFFHPNSLNPSNSTAHSPCVKSDCAAAPMPLSIFSSASAVPKSTEAHKSNDLNTKTTTGSRVGAGGFAGIVLGIVFAVLLAIGIYYVVITRRSNIKRANSVQPDA